MEMIRFTNNGNMIPQKSGNYFHTRCTRLLNNTKLFILKHKNMPCAHSQFGTAFAKNSNNRYISTTALVTSRLIRVDTNCINKSRMPQLIEKIPFLRGQDIEQNFRHRK